MTQVSLLLPTSSNLHKSASNLAVLQGYIENFVVFLILIHRESWKGPWELTWRPWELFHCPKTGSVVFAISSVFLKSPRARGSMSFPNKLLKCLLVGIIIFHLNLLYCNLHFITSFPGPIGWALGMSKTRSQGRESSPLSLSACTWAHYPSTCFDRNKGF